MREKKKKAEQKEMMKGKHWYSSRKMFKHKVWNWFKGDNLPNVPTSMQLEAIRREKQKEADATQEFEDAMWERVAQEQAEADTLKSERAKEARKSEKMRTKSDKIADEIRAKSGGDFLGVFRSAEEAEGAVLDGAKHRADAAQWKRAEAAMMEKMKKKKEADLEYSADPELLKLQQQDANGSENANAHKYGEKGGNSVQAHNTDMGGSSEELGPNPAGREYQIQLRKQALMKERKEKQEREKKREAWDKAGSTEKHVRSLFGMKPMSEAEYEAKRQKQAAAARVAKDSSESGAAPASGGIFGLQDSGTKPDLKPMTYGREKLTKTQ
jgi:hypothetical protein